MRSSYPISLFSPPPKRDGGPSGFVVSVVTHGAIFALLFISVHHARVVEQRPLDLNAVRLLNVQQEEAALHWSPPHAAAHHATSMARHSAFRGGRHGAAAKIRIASIPPTLKPQVNAHQTLIQPDIPPTTRVLPAIPVPQAVVWTAGEVIQRKIVPPAPKPLGATPIKPTFRVPNHELTPSEVALTSTPFTTQAPLPAPGTTMPVRVNGPQPAKQMPQTASVDKGAATAARVISLSNLKLQSGTTALPEINEVTPGDASGILAPGEDVTVSQGGSAPGSGTDGVISGAGTGHSAGNGGDNGSGVTVENGSGDEVADNGDGGSGNGATVFDGSGDNADMGSSDAPEHITQPKGGQYGIVVVGASPEENYPQTAGLWSGRMVYTVYLQTDTPQNWILQYSLPRQHSDPPAGSAQLAAPWPYDMMRPALGRYNIVLVHGFVNTDGHFDQLSVAYPPSFPKSQMLLANLKKWDFRPAMLNGLATTVEVLLIIPGAAD